MLADSTPNAAAFRDKQRGAQAGVTAGTGRRRPGSRANKISGPPARDLADAADPGARRPRPILRDPVRKAQNQNGLMRTAGRLSPEHTDYRVASARQHTGSHRAVCHALWPALVAARRTISASSARVPAHVGSRRRRSRLVDLGATSDSGISMSHRGRIRQEDVGRASGPACVVLRWCGAGAGWPRLARSSNRLPPGRMFRAWCARPYRG